MDTKVIRLQPDNPDVSTLRAVARRLIRGEICILPTDTIYGFHCRADSDAAIRTVQELKGRPEPRPMVVLIPGEDFLLENQLRICAGARLLMDRFWPGPLTLVLPAPTHVSPWLTGGEPSLAVRRPGFPLLRKVLEFAGVPMVSTSVNQTGEEPILEVSEMVHRYGGRVHSIVDTGPPALRAPSTLISFVDEPPRILREGAIPVELIRSLLPEVV